MRQTVEKLKEHGLGDTVEFLDDEDAILARVPQLVREQIEVCTLIQGPVPYDQYLFTLRRAGKGYGSSAEAG